MSADLVILNRRLHACSESIKSGDYGISGESVAELVKFLDSASDFLNKEEQGYQESEVGAFEILTQIHEYIRSPTVDQEVIDMMAFELPKAVAKYACVSVRCSKVVENVVDLFIRRCTAHEMLSILCEAISSVTEPYMVPSYFLPLLGGLAKVFILIKKRHYENVKAAVRVILNILTALSSTSDVEDNNYEGLVLTTFQIAHSIKSASAKLEGEAKTKVQALLGLYFLQITALFSATMVTDVLKCLPAVEYSDLLRHSQLSYIGLITGREVDIIYNLVVEDSNDDCSDCFSDVKLGAAIAVIWGYEASNEMSTAKGDFDVVVEELKGNWAEMWQAISILKYVFSCPSLPSKMKKQGISFLLCLMDGNMSESDDVVDISTLYTSLNAIEKVIMFSPEPELRKQAFSAFKKVLHDIPTSVRFDVLRALLMNSGVSSMIALHIDCVREELHKDRIKDQGSPTLWKPSVMQFVELVLRPPGGGPPSLPEYSDSILSALNLLRFILITESTGNSNYTEILSRGILEKVYNQWLLPLRALVEGIEMQHRKNSDDEPSSDVVSALNPVGFVLYRCIELVEEKQKDLQQPKLK